MPVLLSVNVCAAAWLCTASLPKVRVPGETLAAGAIPMPPKKTLCGLLPALSVNSRLPEAHPRALGAKLTATVHVDPALTGLEVEQVVPEAAIRKGPVTPSALKVRLPTPVFASVTVCAPLAVPTN